MGNQPSQGAETIARVHIILRELVALAREHGVTLVIENIEDMAPSWRQDLAASFASEKVRVNIDTDHAHQAHGATGATGAPPVDRFVSDAGARLAHVPLRDPDGFVDRHWPPGRGTVNRHAVFRAIAAPPQHPHLALELRDAADIPEVMAHLTRDDLPC